MIEIRDLTLTYAANGEVVEALSVLNLEVKPGDRLVVRGPSGSGKSSLLAVLAGLAVPDAGSVELADGTRLEQISPSARAEYRRTQVATVLQTFELIDGLTVEENIRFALELTQHRATSEWVELCVETLGVADLLNRMSHQLSGGQRQRAALVRCLGMAAPLVLLDEPTSALDWDNHNRAVKLIEQLDDTVAVVIATHDARVAMPGSTLLELDGGRLVGSPV